MASWNNTNPRVLKNVRLAPNRFRLASIGDRPHLPRIFNELLIEISPISVPVIVKTTGIRDTSILRVLKVLESFGIVYRTSTRPACWGLHAISRSYPIKLEQESRGIWHLQITLPPPKPPLKGASK